MPPMRRRTRFVLSGLVGLALVVTTLQAQADRADAFIAAQMRQFHLPGVSLVVVNNGTVVKSSGYGLANLPQKVKATPETVYRIGSVSKQFIATGIMLLVQDGRVRLEDPVSKFIADAPAAWQAITIHHLLSHTSGLVRESPAFDGRKAQPDETVIRGAYSTALAFAPGQKWQYSNLGYFILADIIRRVTNQPWSAYLHDHVFVPSGMLSTMPTDASPMPQLLAAGRAGDNNSRNAVDLVALRPSGAFLSTVLDLAKWDAMLDTDRILSKASKDRMWTPVRLSNGTDHPYGLGWHVEESRRHGRLVWHGGGLPGFVSHYARFLDRGLSVIVLTNGEDVDLPSIANGVAQIYLAQ